MNDEQKQRIRDAVVQTDDSPVPENLLTEAVDALLQDMESGSIPIDCCLEVEVTCLPPDTFPTTHVHDDEHGYTIHTRPPHSQRFDELVTELLTEWVMETVEEVEEEMEDLQG